MKPATMETLTWVLIFGGLIVLSLSGFIEEGRTVLALSLAITGAVATVAGVLLIYWRSRIRQDP